jgi:hypothetical protein
MTYREKLVSFHVVERENNKNFLIWTYPTITDDQKKYVLQKCFAGDDQSEYMCWRNNNTWFHIRKVTENKTFAIVILAKEFEPKKYRLLCDILGKKYSKCQNPVELVSLYLNLCMSGSCTLHENGTSYSCNFKNFEYPTNIKEFIRSFDLEIILLYTAILLKRRTLVYHPNTEQLLNELLALSNLVPCRKVDEYLHPVVDNAIKLKGLSFYVAGTTDGDLIKEEHLYDLFVDLQSRQITVSPTAEETMTMTKTHKEIADFLVKLSTSELSEKDIKQQILKKTTDLLSLLKNMATVTAGSDLKMITTNELKSKKFHPALENFLFNLALAENMMML